MGSVDTTCTFRLRGLTARMSGLSAVEQGEFEFPISGPGVGHTESAGDSTFESGYGVLECSEAVEALVTYASFNSASQKTAEAAVFSAEETQSVALYADQTDGSRMGIAIANDTDSPVDYTITAGFAGATVEAPLAVAARGQVAKFLDEFVSQLPAQFDGPVVIRAVNSSDIVTAIGLRFTGAIFSTIPAFVRSP